MIGATNRAIGRVGKLTQMGAREASLRKWHFRLRVSRNCRVKRKRNVFQAEETAYAKAFSWEGVLLRQGKEEGPHSWSPGNKRETRQ